MLKFYERLPSKFLDDPYGIALETKTGNPVKLFNINTDFHETIHVTDKKVNLFLINSKMVYVIPLELPSGEIFGFVFRAVESKKFYQWKLPEYETYPYVYGLHNFEDFKFNEPVIVVEGIKEVQYISRFYPYVLAYLTSQPSKNLFDYLNKITNRVIFIPDNDKAGKQLKWFKKFKNCSKYYCSVYNYKDHGDYYSCKPVEKVLFDDDIRMILSIENIKY